jgi:hypothetical protein
MLYCELWSFPLKDLTFIIIELIGLIINRKFTENAIAIFLEPSGLLGIFAKEIRERYGLRCDISKIITAIK